MTRLDLLLLLMVLIWGANFSIVKIALRDFPELAFNAARLILASAVFLGAMWWIRRASVTNPGAEHSERTHAAWAPFSRDEWRRVAVLGIVGHLVYQLCFLGGVKRTSVGNASLIIGTTPVVVTLLTALAGHERVPPLRWAGVGLSFIGLYLIVGHQVQWAAAGHLGDALMFGSAICWAVYSVGSVRLLKRHSPLDVTGWSMTIGAALYTVAASPALTRVDWSAISRTSWMLMAASAVFALAVAYLIWYTAVQRLGTTRTSVSSYLTPIVAMVVAAVWLQEPVTTNQLAGAGAIFAGVFITRVPR